MCVLVRLCMDVISGEENRTVVLDDDDDDDDQDDMVLVIPTLEVERASLGLCNILIGKLQESSSMV